MIILHSCFFLTLIRDIRYIRDILVPRDFRNAVGSRVGRCCHRFLHGQAVVDIAEMCQDVPTHSVETASSGMGAASGMSVTAANSTSSDYLCPMFVSFQILKTHPYCICTCILI